MTIDIAYGCLGYLFIFIHEVIQNSMALCAKLQERSFWQTQTNNLRIKLVLRRARVRVRQLEPTIHNVFAPFASL